MGAGWLGMLRLLHGAAAASGATATPWGRRHCRLGFIYWKYRVLTPLGCIPDVFHQVYIQYGTYIHVRLREVGVSSLEERRLQGGLSGSS